MQRAREILQTLTTQLQAEKKKAAALGGLCVVFLVVLIRAFVVTGAPEPAKAGGATPVAVNRPKPDPVAPRVRPTPIDPAAQTKQGNGAVDRAHRLISQARSVFVDDQSAVYIDEMPRDIPRDPFNTTDWGKFTIDLVTPLGAEDKGSKDPETGPFWQRIGEAMTAFQEKQTEQSRQMQVELSALTLQSTMTGSVPLAYISGQLVREGDDVRGFSVLRIQERRVLLRRDGVTCKLAMP